MIHGVKCESNENIWKETWMFEVGEAVCFRDMVPHLALGSLFYTNTVLERHCSPVIE